MEHIQQPPFDWGQAQHVGKDIPIKTEWQIFPGGFAIQKIPYSCVDTLRSNSTNEGAEGFAIHVHRDFLRRVLEEMDKMDNMPTEEVTE